MSPGSFSRQFRKHVGVPFSSWQCSLRVAYAKQIIIENEWLQIHEVGRLVGYHHEATFERAFKRYQSMTPGQCRKIVRTNQELNSNFACTKWGGFSIAVCHLSECHPAALPLLSTLVLLLKSVDSVAAGNFRSREKIREEHF